MSDEKRKINIIKQGKKYLGGISIPSDIVIAIPFNCI
jgi:hypothetical protein